MGPTKCDEQRDKRQKDIDNVWQELISSDEYTKTYPLFDSAIDLLREATSCYQNGAYMATAIMCRSMVETFLYYSVTRQVTQRWQDTGTVASWQVQTLSDDKYGVVLQGAKTKYAIEGKIEKIMNDIRHEGNFAAHYGSGLDKRDVSTIKKKDTWINRQHALLLLRKTVTVIKYLYKQSVAA